jgi:hypothetical protein
MVIISFILLCVVEFNEVFNFVELGLNLFYTF